ncbi:MAG: sigma-70 family RNA polymerase sigma factor [Isosphaeraceae bacterium]
MLSVMADPANPTGPGELPGGAIDWSSALGRHERWLRTAVLARLGLGDRQAVDEVLQEVALAAVAQRSPLADPSRVGAWLHRLAVVQVLLYRRRHGRRRKLLDSYSQRAEATASVGNDPLGWLLLDERRELVRKAMAGLPSRDAEVLMLKYTEGWSYRRLADHLGISEAAVEARLHRARRKLRDDLTRLGAAGEDA